MKSLFVFCCVFFLAWSSSAQCYDFEEDFWGNMELVQVPCDEDVGNGGGVGTGDDGSDPNPPTTIYCRTNHNILSETVIPCGSGFAVVTTWQASCTSGNAGSCQVGTYTEFSGCFDGELPEEETNLSTQYCN